MANNNNTDGSDEFTVSFAEVTFPSIYLPFGCDSNACFTMPASDTGNFLQVTQFNYGGGGVPPVLLDLTNGLRITGDLSVPGMVQWVLPAFHDLPGAGR